MYDDNKTRSKFVRVPYLESTDKQRIHFDEEENLCTQVYVMLTLNTSLRTEPMTSVYQTVERVLLWWLIIIMTRKLG